MAARNLQLNPMAKKLLLGHRVLAQKKVFGGENNGSKLVKFLMISRSFLNLSQRDKIYEFLIWKYDEYSNYMFMCKFTANYMTKNCAQFNLNFEGLYKLIWFLRPQEISINMGNICGFEAAEQCKKVLDLVYGKIKLLSDDGYKTHVAPIINILSTKHQQICSVECVAEVLSDTNLVPCRLNLDSCILSDLTTYGQLNVILQNHNIKNLVLMFDRTYNKGLFKFTDLENYFLPAPFVEDLTLMTDEMAHYDSNQGIDDEDFLKKTSKLLSFFPNLRHFKCDARFKRAKNLLVNKTLDNFILGLYNECRQIQEKFPLRTMLQFNFDESLEIEGFNYSNRWLDQLKNHPDFANARNIEINNYLNEVYFIFDHRIVEENFNFSIHMKVDLRNLGVNVG